jgi:Immunity protein 27
MVKQIDVHETRIVGAWTLVGGKMLADEACNRVEQLTSHALQKLGVSTVYGGWETLFRDPVDGRLWERTYPQGELHGGGPPQLAVISIEDARRKYGNIV